MTGDALPMGERRAISCRQAAGLLSLPARALYDPRRRRRLGLPAVRVGRRLVFIEADVLNLLDRGREHLGAETRS